MSRLTGNEPVDPPAREGRDEPAIDPRDDPCAGDDADDYAEEVRGVYGCVRCGSFSA